MDFRLGARGRSRSATRCASFLAEHVTDEMIERAHDHRHRCTTGSCTGRWPTRAGSSAAGPRSTAARRGPVEMDVLAEELVARRARRSTAWASARWWRRTLLIDGTDEQKRDHPAPASWRARSLCCLGYSEPDAGSDVAAARRPVPCATATTG